MTVSIQTTSTNDKKEKYKILLPQIKSLIEGETNRISSLSNVAAALKYSFDFFWVGFYLIENQMLVLGPFQGEPACSRIGFNKGVCGTSWAQQKTIIVNDVNQFEGHIACSSLSQSEIVVPLIHQGEIVGVLDIDSEHLSHFDSTDAFYLETLSNLLTDYCF